MFYLKDICGNIKALISVEQGYNLSLKYLKRQKTIEVYSDGCREQEVAVNEDFTKVFLKCMATIDSLLCV